MWKANFPSTLWESAFFADFHRCGIFHSAHGAIERGGVDDGKMKQRRIVSATNQRYQPRDG